MNLCIEVSPKIPRLAWLAVIRDNAVFVLRGSEVADFEHGVFEGSWAGNFEELEFTTCSNCFGSGLKVGASSVTFVPPSHPLESLFTYQTAKEVFVSNSFAFLAETINFEIKVGPKYGAIFSSIACGLEQANNSIAESKEGVLRRISVTNFEVFDNEIHIRSKPKFPEFETYEQYVSYLESTITKVFQNSACDKRLTPFFPIATCSSGYDSVACSVLASRAGAKSGITLRSSRGGYLDSGRQVLEQLNVEAFEFDRLERASGEDLPEVEFLSTGMGGEDYVYGVFERKIKNSVMTTGFFADAVWDPNSHLGLSFERDDNSGSSFSEFRLRVGFIHLPVPVIGFSSKTQPQILAIASTNGMSKYWRDSNYNKPVPRRIAEEFGVSRTSFGQTKKAASMHFFLSPKFLSDRSLLEFLEFSRERITIPVSISQCLWKTVYYVIRILLILRTKIDPRLIPANLDHALIKWRTIIEHSSPVYSDLMFVWAVSEVRKRYRGTDVQRTHFKVKGRSS